MHQLVKFVVALSILFLPTHVFSLENSLVFDHVNVVDVKNGTIQTNQTVVVQDNIIQAVGKSGEIAISDSAKIVNAPGKYLIPGLWDMHTHVAQLSFVESHKRYTEVMLPLFIANGVTGIRDLGGQWDLLKKWKKEIQAGKMIGPRIKGTGLMLDGPGTFFEGTIALESKEHAKKVATQFIEDGVDFLKIQSLITPEAFEGVMEVANEKGIDVVGHVPWSMDAFETSDAGVKSIEHVTGVLFKGKQEVPFVLGTPYSAEERQKMYQTFAKNGTWHSPTHVWVRRFSSPHERSFAANDPRLNYIPQRWIDEIWEPLLKGINSGRALYQHSPIKASFQNRMRVTHEMQDAGIKMLAGTDVSAAYVLPGFSLHTELAFLVASGLSPLEALQSATLNPAIFFGMEKQLGSIEVGKWADMVLIENDPLEKINSTEEISAVVFNGTHYSAPDLKKLLAGIQEAAGK